MLCDCFAVNQPEFSPFSYVFRISMMSLHLLVMVVGCGGTASVILVFVSDRGLWKPSYIFIGFLAFIDMMHLLLVGSFKVQFLQLKRWTDETGCWWSGVATMYLMTASILTTVMIAVNRYIRVCYSVAMYQKLFPTRLVPLMCMGILVFNWLGSIRAKVTYYPNLPSCFLDVGRSEVILFLIVILYVTGYCVVVTLYFRITRKLTVIRRKLMCNPVFKPIHEQAWESTTISAGPVPKFCVHSPHPLRQRVFGGSFSLLQKWKERAGGGRKDPVLTVPVSGSLLIPADSRSCSTSIGPNCSSLLPETSRRLPLSRPDSPEAFSVANSGAKIESQSDRTFVLSETTERVSEFSGDKPEWMPKSCVKPSVGFPSEEQASWKERFIVGEQTVKSVPGVMALQEPEAEGLAPGIPALDEVSRKDVPAFVQNLWKWHLSSVVAGSSRNVSRQGVPFAHLSKNQFSQTSFRFRLPFSTSRTAAERPNYGPKATSFGKPVENLKFAFVVCVLNMTACVPFWVCFVMSEMFQLSVPEELQSVSHLLVLCVSALNCVVYGVMNNKFQESGWNLYKRLRCWLQESRMCNRISPQKDCG